MDRGNVRNIQSFSPKNKFEKLVHLVGFIIRIPYFIILNYLSKSLLFLLFISLIKLVNRPCPLHWALCSSVYIYIYKRILHAAGSIIIFAEKYVTLTNLYFAQHPVCAGDFLDVASTLIFVELDTGCCLKCCRQEQVYCRISLGRPPSLEQRPHLLMENVHSTDPKLHHWKLQSTKKGYTLST